MLFKPRWSTHCQMKRNDLMEMFQLILIPTLITCTLACMCASLYKKKVCVCVLSLYHIAVKGGGRDQWEETENEKESSGGTRNTRKTARWENSASETEGRKERRIMREEESGDGKERKGGSFDVPFSQSVCWCTSVAGMSVQDMCACPSVLADSSE